MEPVPDFIEPLVGYKQFNYAHDPSGGTRLLSWNSTPWTLEPMKAACIIPRGRHECAFSPCPEIKTDDERLGHTGKGCGIYAYNSTESINIPESPETIGWWGAWADQVAAKVLLWGTVYIYEKGYRAEYCQIKTVYLPVTDEKKRESLKEMCSKFGFNTADGIEVYNG